MARPDWMHPRLYQWVKPRSLGLHLLFVLIAGGCGMAAWWQVERAMQGNTLSYLYSIEWPGFAVVAGIGWWQMFHDTPEDIANRRAYHVRMKAASAAVVARTLPRHARALTVESEEVNGRVLDAKTAPAIAASSVLDASTGQALARLDRTPAHVDDSAGLLEDEPDQGAADEMTEYNRYLATLAVKGKAKTWRNPHGL